MTSLVTLSCATEETQPVKQYRFYDFDMAVEIHTSLGIHRKYILANAWAYHSKEVNEKWESYPLKTNSLYVVNYDTPTSVSSDSKPYESAPTDTFLILLRKTQIDTIYTLTREAFTIPYQQNTSSDEKPPSIGFNDGLSALVTLDLGLRGDYYRLGISDANDGFDLHTYLQAILAKHKQTHPQ
ncbi:hypothetical protein LGH70_08440 [Hymenobacter sp. BT635]|uniref:Uncharacterized protein n=1 Tax=Hymenobacter nitidus TaxID=2880929 RepID=A0ABS8AB20_9BACT|nr:hypothetical protein [Hymenobacter nitidus]MCB2377608.1 hypothetical protein [Hymenobacter nitidus]